MTPAQVARDLAITAIDLTRACAHHELYTDWLSLNLAALNGSAGVANYFFLAALAFEDQAHPQLPAPYFDPFVVREDLADILMASAPLSCEELRAAVTTAINQARTPDVTLNLPLTTLARAIADALGAAK